MKSSYYAQIEIARLKEEFEDELSNGDMTLEEVISHDLIKCDCGLWVLPEEKQPNGCDECLSE
jgi:hypothetical protein